jgi:hypothetical protein
VPRLRSGSAGPHRAAAFPPQGGGAGMTSAAPPVWYRLNPKEGTAAKTPRPRLRFERERERRLRTPSRAGPARRADRATTTAPTTQSAMPTRRIVRLLLKRERGRMRRNRRSPPADRGAEAGSVPR